MSEGKKLLIVIMAINLVGLMAVLSDIDLIWVSAFVMGFNVLLLPHLNTHMKEKNV